jgi:hypothetical protein
MPNFGNGNGYVQKTKDQLYRKLNINLGLSNQTPLE